MLYFDYSKAYNFIITKFDTSNKNKTCKKVRILSDHQKRKVRRFFVVSRLHFPAVSKTTVQMFHSSSLELKNENKTLNQKEKKRWCIVVKITKK